MICANDLRSQATRCNLQLLHDFWRILLEILVGYRIDPMRPSAIGTARRLSIATLVMALWVIA